MTLTAKKEYNYCLDFIKGLACIFVVFMHCEFPGIVGIGVQAISRFCVPFFFMVSGYFCFSQKQSNHNEATSSDKWNTIKRKVVHVAKIILWSSLLYLAFAIAFQFVFHSYDFTINTKKIFDWIVFNQPWVLSGHLWFLFALLYVYIFYGIFECNGLRKYAYIIAAVMFVVYICLAQGAYLIGVTIPNIYYRNWIVEGFPFFMLGHWIHENHDRINLSNTTLIIIIVLTTVLCCVERWLLGRDFGVNIVTIPQVWALFVYGVKNPLLHEGGIQRMGRDCSMYIYILHIAVWQSIVNGAYSLLGISESLPAQYFKPVAVLVLTIILSLLLNSVIKLYKSKRISTKTA